MRRHPKLWAALRLGLLFALLPAAAHPAEPRRVADFDPRLATLDSDLPNASNFLPLGPRALFFVSSTLTDPRELLDLWITDGTAAGTERVASIGPHYSSPVLLGATSRYAFFLDGRSFVSEAPPRLDLHRTDGTGPGTLTLASFEPPPVDAHGALRTEGAVFGDRLYFSGCSPAFGCEPWTSDGTPGGTRRLREITPGPFGSGPHGFVSLDGAVYFWANDPTGTALWRSDGTTAGTIRVVTLPPFTDPGPIESAGGRLFFVDGKPTDSAPTPPSNLWVSDGTPAGTHPLAPFDRGWKGGPRAVRFLGPLRDGLVFLGTDRRLRTRLWWTDGTARDTRQVDPQPAGQVLLNSEGTLAALPGGLIFPGPHGELRILRDPRSSPEPLEPCGSGCPNLFSDTSELPFFTVVAGRAYFSGSTPGGGAEPWVTDGTVRGTRRLADACPGACGSYLRFSAGPSGQVYFTDGDGRLWESDGTPAGTRILLDGEPRAFLGPNALAPVGPGGSAAVFATGSPGRGGEVWRVDAASGRVEPIHRTSDGLSSNPRFLGTAGDDAVLFACDGEDHGAIWRAGLLVPPRRLLPALSCSEGLYPFPWASVGDATYFAFAPPGHLTASLFRTDGTPEGTIQLTHFEPPVQVTLIQPLNGGVALMVRDVTEDSGTIWFAGPDSAEAEPLVPGKVAADSRLLADGNLLYFFRLEEGRDVLWRSDGTGAGTVRLADLGFHSLTDLESLTHLGDATFVLIIRSTFSSLWRTNGTPEGTRWLLPDPRHPFDNPSPREPATFGGALYFLGETLFPATSISLVRTPGRVLGTSTVRRFSSPLTYPSPPSRLTVWGDAFYFVADDGDHGPELWRSDGSTAGTWMVRDLHPGPDGSRIEEVFAGGGRLYFGADDGEHGVELWQSDGTEAGTVRLSDLNPGPASSFPRDFQRTEGALYFSADDGTTGREPWALPLEAGSGHSATPARRP